MNYKFKYYSGTLTIKPADQTIKWDQDFDNIPIGSQVELDAVSSSGLAIRYLTSNENIAQIYRVGEKYYVDCIGEGTVQIRAYAEGNSNYNATQRISKTLRIVNTTPVNIITSDRNNNIKQVSTNLIGQEVDTEYKGIIIKNGKKYLQK